MNNQITKQTDHWIKMAEHDFEVYMYLYKGKKFSETLFFGHIVLEKILKAHIIKHTGKLAPKTHDLVRLHELADLNFSEEIIDELDQINQFNIRARYPDYKDDFYRKCTKEYTERYYKKINSIYKKLCKLIKA